MSAHEPWRRVFPSRSEAEAFLNERGFSVGRMQGLAERGVMFGKVDIRKWRNLSSVDRAGLHGVVTQLFETGVAVVTICADAPVEAHNAIRANDPVTT